MTTFELVILCMSGMVSVLLTYMIKCLHDIRSDLTLYQIAITERVRALEVKVESHVKEK